MARAFKHHVLSPTFSSSASSAFETEHIALPRRRRLHGSRRGRRKRGCRGSVSDPIEIQPGEESEAFHPKLSAFSPRRTILIEEESSPDKPSLPLLLAMDFAECGSPGGESTQFPPTTDGVPKSIWRSSRRFSADVGIGLVAHLPVDAAKLFVQSSFRSTARRLSCALFSQDVSLWCPIALTRIQVPARGKYCHHTQCFDLRTFLRGFLSGSSRRSCKCPLCPVQLRRSTLIIDDYFAQILAETAGHIRHVQLFPDASYCCHPSDTKVAEYIDVG